MTSRPRWIWWAGATVLICAFWVSFVHLPLRQRDLREEALRTEWAARQQAMLDRIESAPAVIALLDSLSRELESVAGYLPHSPRLRQYLDDLAESGRQCGVRSVEVRPELESMMSLAKTAGESLLLIDTLMIEFNAFGDFHHIGSWLDDIESQAAFRQWRLGRWDKGEEPGTIHFSGSAAFLVVVPRGESS